jgi:peptide-methionine (S)-S-oxide reductase
MKIFSLIFTACAILLVSFSIYAQTQTAIFAGGCFWSMQHDFDKVKGIVNTTVGYTGGTVVNPTYEQVSAGDTGHYEAIKVEYDPAVISYQKVLDFYLHDIDPSDFEGQFCDHGNEYKPVVFYSDANQKKMASEMKDQLSTSKKFPKVALNILPAQIFYPAEEYHQKFAEKNPARYSAYRTGCQRDATLQAVWGK